MKSFEKLIAAVVLTIVLLCAVVNILLLRLSRGADNFYKVEISRVENELADGNDLTQSSYDTILGVYENNGGAYFYNSTNKYVIREINGRQYRIEYDDRTAQNDRHVYIIVNAAFAVFAAVTLGVLFYVRQRIIDPFNEISELPRELSKGNITVPLKESKSRYFGKFIWGLDMLREELERAKQQRLDKISSEKTLLLSLSHDIKTPLSAIKLYSQALAKGLYPNERVAESISAKVDEIEGYVSEIVRNSDSDFMTFEIVASEFYMSHVINKIADSYRETLSAAGTLFEINDYTDCMLSGDPDRLFEVLQNVIENAIKYGDGERISLGFSDEEDCRLITVSNSGCTLPEAELSHIFNSFWRGSNTANKQGSGLGLYICRRLMKEMGGDIFAEISNGDMKVTLVCRKAC